MGKNHYPMVIFHSYDKLPEGNFFELNGWLVGGIPTPLKNIKVSWDDEIPNIWKNKFHVPNHQPDGHITRKTSAVKPALLHIPT